MGFVEKSHRSQARGVWYEARGKPFPLVTSRSVPLARALGQEPSESCGLGAVVRVYQCQSVNEPVNAAMRSVKPTATPIRWNPLVDRARYDCPTHGVPPSCPPDGR